MMSGKDFLKSHVKYSYTWLSAVAVRSICLKAKWLHNSSYNLLPAYTIVTDVISVVKQHSVKPLQTDGQTMISTNPYVLSFRSSGRLYQSHSTLIGKWRDVTGDPLCHGNEHSEILTSAISASVLVTWRHWFLHPGPGVMGLSPSEDGMIVARVILTRYRTVTDGQTERQTDRQAESVIQRSAYQAMPTRCKTLASGMVAQQHSLVWCCMLHGRLR